MHECGGSFERLYEIGLQGVFEQCGHGAFGVQLARGDRLVVARVADYDARKALLEVGDAGSQAEDGHDFRGNRDVEAVLARHAVGLAAHAADDIAQLTVVHVNRALPRDLAHVEPELVALVDMVVDHSGKQVVRSADGVEVSREVKVDVLHRNDLGPAAACSAALDAEHGTERRLTQGNDHVFADLAHAVGQTDRRGGFAFACGRGIDGGHQDKLAGLMLFIEQQVVIYLGLV